METIHLYVVRQEETRPSSLLPLFFALLCLVFIIAVTVYSGDHPFVDHQTVRVQAILLPLKTFTTSVRVIPTGVKMYPATHATGTLTITNGSIVSEELPKGMIFTGNENMEVVTDTAVFVPAGSAAGYGVATVSAHLVTSGINMARLDINQVVGTSLYVRNLSPFTGGRKAYSVAFVTPQDRLRAIIQARQALFHHTLSGLLFTPCKEIIAGNVTLTWQCQFVTYAVPSYMKVTNVRVQGKQLLVDVVFIERPKRIETK
jgi:hypothetical protein